MSGKFWGRTVKSSLDWTIGFEKMFSLPSGISVLRIRFGWGFTGFTPATGDLLSVMRNLQVMGICTTVGDGGGPPPDPRTDSSDVDPPSQRWLHWESRAPVITSADGRTELVTWRDSGPQYEMDTKGMVSGASVPDGEFLTVWFSWAAAYDWPAEGHVQMWMWASLLVEVP